MISSQHGLSEFSKKEDGIAINKLKQNLTILNESLTSDYLCGSNLTIADIAVAATLDDLFRITLSEQVRKTITKVVAWYEKVKSNKSVKKYFGGV